MRQSKGCIGHGRYLHCCLYCSCSTAQRRSSSDIPGTASQALSSGAHVKMCCSFHLYLHPFLCSLLVIHSFFSLPPLPLLWIHELQNQDGMPTLPTIQQTFSQNSFHHQKKAEGKVLSIILCNKTFNKILYHEFSFHHTFVFRTNIYL